MPEGSVKADHANNVENFVAAMFTQTDKEERTDETITKKHAMLFNRASHFIMLLSIFDNVYDDAWEEKRKYCVFKAGTIMKALKEGKQPSRGNPNDPNNNGERQLPDEEKKEESEPEIKPKEFPPSDGEEEEEKQPSG
jgi:hypothetical protein